jgi:hypothetical protein
MKWRNIAYFGGMDMGIDNCALCQQFFFPAASRCYGCPVFEKTGHKECIFSPHGNWIMHQYKEHQTKLKVCCPECVELAEEEIKFLELVLEEEIKKGVEDERDTKTV